VENRQARACNLPQPTLLALRIIAGDLRKGSAARTT
jgi:hypothetical protein